MSAAIDLSNIVDSSRCVREISMQERISVLRPRLRSARLEGTRPHIEYFANASGTPTVMKIRENDIKIASDISMAPSALLRAASRNAAIRGSST